MDEFENLIDNKEEIDESLSQELESQFSDSQDLTDEINTREDFVETENRFAILEKVNKEKKSALIKQSEKDAKQKNKDYKTKV